MIDNTTSDLIAIPEGGFAYLPGDSRVFSQGVVTLYGYNLRRIRLAHPLPIMTGIAFAAAFIRKAERSLNAFCGCELRIPNRLTKSEFSNFNRGYIGALKRSGFSTNPTSPAARKNIVPINDPPTEAILTAFTFAVPGRPHANKGPDFLLSGKPELDDDRVVAPNDTSREGMQQKAVFVRGDLQESVRMLGARWHEISAVNLYSGHADGTFTSIFEGEFSVTHTPGYPPVVGPHNIFLEFEADVRSITTEETV